MAALVAALAQIIFDGGKLHGEVDVPQGTRLKLVEGAVQVVLMRLREVDDSLMTVSTARSHSDISTETAVQAREAYCLATIRSEVGIQDLLTVLDSQRSQRSAAHSLIQT